ncbi:hypothetical protein BDF19DRAFT_411997 [Syncephalis fuscata]|nr:hypothetical protein BDF19DRAFT_411997 [Syncephalis fuscata]
MSWSMSKTITQQAQVIHRFGVIGMIIYSIGTALVIGSSILFYNRPTPSAYKTAATLARLGYGISLAINLLSAGLFVWQYVQSKHSSHSGLGFKCRQLLVLAAHCILIFAPDLSYVLDSDKVSHVFNILVLSIGIYTRKALTRFDEVPNVILIIPVIIPDAACSQQTMNMVYNPNPVLVHHMYTGQPVQTGQPSAYQHHANTKKTKMATTASLTSVKTANSSESNIS